MDLDLRHDEEGRRYVAVIDGHEAYVAYRPADDTTLELHHTYVPDALRGRGIAGTLVSSVLEQARAQGFAVIPTCSYVRGFLERHPEYADLAPR